MNNQKQANQTNWKYIAILIIFAGIAVTVIILLLFRPNVFSKTKLTASDGDTTEIIDVTTNADGDIIKTTPEDWVYTNEQVTITITPGTDASHCNITWHEGESGDVTFYTIDAAGVRSELETHIDPLTSAGTSSCKISQNITELSYLGVAINAVDSGGMQSPDGGYAHVMYTLTDNPTTVYPNSGQWSYHMTASSENLSCVLPAGSISASGPVQFITSNYGMSATMTGDSASIYFYRPDYGDPHYESPDYGIAQFELDVIDQEYMTGFINIEADAGCTGQYPITLDFQFPTAQVIYVPHQGSWNMEFGPLTCGSTPIDIGLLPGLPLGVSDLSIIGGGPVPMQLSFTGGYGTTLNQTLGSNNYNTFPNMYLGVGTEYIFTDTGPIPLPFSVMGTWNVTALSESSMIGTVLVSGSNGCVGATTVNLTYL